MARKKRLEFDDRGTLGVMMALVRIPFMGKPAALILFLPPIYLIMMPFLVKDMETEAETEATIVSIAGTERLARKVEYEYTVDGKHYTGTLQWVNLDERPEIRTGAKIKVYYLVESPTFSRDPSEPTTKGTMYIMAAIWAGGWTVLFLVSLIWKYHHRRSILPKFDESGPIQRNR